MPCITPYDVKQHFHRLSLALRDYLINKHRSRVTLCLGEHVNDTIIPTPPTGHKLISPKNRKGDTL